MLALSYHPAGWTAYENGLLLLELALTLLLVGLNHAAKIGKNEKKRKEFFSAERGKRTEKTVDNARYLKIYS